LCYIVGVIGIDNHGNLKAPNIYIFWF